MRDALLNIETIIALNRTQDTTPLQPQFQSHIPNLQMAAPLPLLSPTNLQMATFPLAILSSAKTSSANTKVLLLVPALPLTLQDNKQMVKNIVNRRKSKRGRVFTYNELYAFVEDPHNTLLLLTPSTLETFIRDEID